jgi:hypothetical protein
MRTCARPYGRARRCDFGGWGVTPSATSASELRMATTATSSSTGPSRPRRTVSPARPAAVAVAALLALAEERVAGGRCGAARGGRRVPPKYATSSRITGLDPFGPAVRPEQRSGTEVTHFESSWTGMTQTHKFEDRRCILLSIVPP